MTALDLITPVLIALALCVSRYAGFVVVSPFPGATAPTTQKIALVVALAWFSISTVDTSRAPTALGLPLVLASLTELACGVVIGFAVRLVMLAADVLASSLAGAVGLSTPTLFDPNTEAQDTPLHRVVSLTATLLALGVGVHRIALAHLVHSMEALPPGGTPSLAAAAGPVVALFVGGFEVGVRLSLPVVGVGLVVQLALGIVARAAPALQIFNVGFGVTIIAGLATLFDSFERISAGLANAFAGTSERLSVVVGAIGGR